MPSWIENSLGVLVALGAGLFVIAFIAFMLFGSIYRTTCELPSGEAVEAYSLQYVPYLSSPGGPECESTTATRILLGKAGVLSEVESETMPPLHENDAMSAEVGKQSQHIASQIDSGNRLFRSIEESSTDLLALRQEASASMTIEKVETALADISDIEHEIGSMRREIQHTDTQLSPIQLSVAKSSPEKLFLPAWNSYVKKHRKNMSRSDGVLLAALDALEAWRAYLTSVYVTGEPLEKARMALDDELAYVAIRHGLTEESVARLDERRFVKELTSAIESDPDVRSVANSIAQDHPGGILDDYLD